MKIKKYRAVYALVTLLCVFFTYGSQAQEKKILKVADYALWKSAPKITSAETSEDGSWYVYKIGNDSSANIFLKNIKTGLQRNFKAKYKPSRYKSYKPRTDFSKDSKHYAFISNDTLRILHLNTGKMSILTGIKDFWFAGEGQYLLSEGNLPKNKKMWLMDLKNQSTINVDHVEQFQLDPTRRAVCAVVNKENKRAINVIRFKPGFPTSSISSTQENNYAQLTWNDTGNAFAFYETKSVDKNAAISKIHVCSNFGLKPKVRALSPEGHPNLPKNYVITSKDKLHLSANGKQLFFFLTKNNVSEANLNLKDVQGIEVWLPTDLVLSPEPDSKYDDYRLWYQWTPEEDRLMAVTDGNFTRAILTGNEKKALIYHTRGYLPKHKYVNDFIDIFIKDLGTGRSKLLLEKVWKQSTQLSISPGGKYIAYFKDKNWWAYDIEQDSHRCLTTGFNTVLENIELDRVATVPPYKSPGWLKNDRQLIIYDQNDIWLLNADGKKNQRITNGIDTKKTFRLVEEEVYSATPSPNEFGFISRAYNEIKGLLISSVNNQSLDNGLLMWTPKSGLSGLMEKPFALTTYGRLKPNQSFLFAEHTFDLPPRLMLFKTKNNVEQLNQTGPDPKEYTWGKSELVHFTTPEGKQLKGALFYPADYTIGKRYPMVVEIYEKKTRYLHDYQLPSPYDPKVANFTTEGYFFFMPDISYEPNNPGISATKCVVAGVEKVINMGIVDKENIGLMGFSFGGYETSFIVTQTDLFKTAVAGAGITDLLSWPILISSFGPNFNRVEEDQHRMTNTFLGEDYARNSPMHYIHQMNTPILLWSGDKDTNVDVSQTKSYHTALWRLGKPSTMLIYEGENHSFVKPENELDITRRIKNWFDHYLKGEPKADWMFKRSN